MRLSTTALNDEKNGQDLRLLFQKGFGNLPEGWVVDGLVRKGW